MDEPHAIQDKIQELTDALKAEGLWRQYQPIWVSRYNQDRAACPVDFFEWLQFVYLPNCQNGRGPRKTNENYITLQVRQFAGAQIVNDTIMRLLVELDALT